MSDAKFTPGPWQCGFSEGKLLVATANHYPAVVVAEVAPRPERAGGTQGGNGRLIAAAPGLLRELEETAAWLDERAEVLLHLSAAGGPTKGAAEKRQAIRDEAARLRGRAGVIRQTILGAKGGAA